MDTCLHTSLLLTTAAQWLCGSNDGPKDTGSMPVAAVVFISDGGEDGRDPYAVLYHYTLKDPVVV